MKVPTIACCFFLGAVIWYIKQKAALLQSILTALAYLLLAMKKIPTQEF